MRGCACRATASPSRTCARRSRRPAQLSTSAWTRVRAALAAGASSAVEVAQLAYGPFAGDDQAVWMFAEALCMLEHLELRGEARLGGPLSWAPAPTIV